MICRFQTTRLRASMAAGRSGGSAPDRRRPRQHHPVGHEALKDGRILITECDDLTNGALIPTGQFLSQLPAAFGPDPGVVAERSGAQVITAWCSGRVKSGTPVI